MPKVPLKTIISHCDRILRTAEIGDYDGAVNGLQAGNSGSVTRIAATVDASLATVKMAVAAKADLGNNAQLAAALGLKKLKPFFASHGQEVGLKTAAKISRAELAKRIERATGVKPKLIPGGREICERIGIVTGGAGGDLAKAVAGGVDTFITGEGPHWTYALAEELGVNVFYGGHYATETFGVKALAAALAKKFKLPWEFLDHPTDL